MKKSFFLYLILICFFHNAFGNRLERLENIIDYLHRFAAECPRIAYEEVDGIFDQVFEATLDLTHNEIAAIFQSEKDKKYPFQKANELASEYNSSSCEYIANRMKVIGDVSLALTQIGKGHECVKDATSEDFLLAQSFIEKKNKEEINTAKKNAQA